MATLEISDELAQQLQRRAQQLRIPFEQLIVSVLQKSLYPKHGVFLTPEQFAFMRQHHDEVMLAMVDGKLADISGDAELDAAADKVIDTILASAHYKQLFGDMGWDDLIDSYEDTPGYDNSLWIELHNQMRRDLADGSLKPAPRPLSSRALDAKRLEKLRKLQNDEYLLLDKMRLTED